MTPELLARHVHHVLELLDPTHLRCHTCHRTLLITTSTSVTSPRPATPTTPEAPCPRHRYEPAATCRSCAADRKADEHRHVHHQPTADIATRAAEARAQLPPRRRHHTSPPPDPAPMDHAGGPT